MGRQQHKPSTRISENKEIYINPQDRQRQNKRIKTKTIKIEGSMIFDISIKIKSAAGYLMMIRRELENPNRKEW